MSRNLFCESPINLLHHISWIISTSSNCVSFKAFLVQEKRKQPCGEGGVLYACGMRCLATVAAQVEPSVLVSCDECDTQQIAVFLVIYSKMLYEDISTLLNKSASFSIWLCGSYSCCTIPS